MERMEGARLTKGADALTVEGRRRNGRRRLRWEDCVKRDVVEVGGELRMRARDGGGVETGGGDGSETGLVMKKKWEKSTTGIGISHTPDYRYKE